MARQTWGITSRQEDQILSLLKTLRESNSLEEIHALADEAIALMERDEVDLNG